MVEELVEACDVAERRNIDYSHLSGSSLLGHQQYIMVEVML
jgi:hypothetical protein